MERMIYLTGEGINGVSYPDGADGQGPVMYVKMDPQEMDDADAGVIRTALGRGMRIEYGDRDEDRLCPCCGGYLFSEKDAYEICPVCGWEDDPSQRRDASLPGGANRLSLEEAREEFRRSVK